MKNDTTTIHDRYSSVPEVDNFFYDEHDKKNISGILKQDNEFFNDEDNIPGNCISVKRKSTSSKEDWYIYINGEEFLVVKGIRFTSPEREFLRTVDGVKFLIDGIKSGWKSVSEIKRQLKNKV